MLRLVLNDVNEKFAVFGVDIRKRPENIPKDIMFYYGTEKMFRNLDINVTKGIYVYRYKDHFMYQLVQKDDFNEAIQNRLSTIDDIDLTKKSFFAGYILDPKNSTTNEIEMRLLHKLAKKYGNEIYFAPLPINFSEKTNTILSNYPKFFIFDNKDNLTNFYSEEKHNLHNYTKLDNLVQNVINGKEKYYKYSWKNISDPQSISFNEFQQKIVESNNTKDTFLIVSSIYNEYVDCKVKVEKAFELIKGGDYELYNLNASVNSIPSIIGKPNKVINLYMFPQGNKDKPIEFGRDIDIIEILEFIKLKTTYNITIEEFNLREVDKEINNRRNSLMEEVEYVTNKYYHSTEK